jgi:predicted nucleic acid-binding Zn finger protein
MFPRPEHISDFIRYALHAHLRVLIVRRDFKGRDHVAVLRLELLLHPTVGEERYVCLFLRFCRCTMSVARLVQRGKDKRE